MVSCPLCRENAPQQLQPARRHLARVAGADQRAARFHVVAAVIEAALAQERPQFDEAVFDLRLAQIDAQSLAVADVISDERSRPASDIEETTSSGEMSGDGPEFQIVPAIADARLPLIDLVVIARGNPLFIIKIGVYCCVSGVASRSPNILGR